MGVTQQEPSPANVLAKAYNKAAKIIGLTQADSCAILGVSRSTFSRMLNSGIDKDTLQGQMSLLLVRLYRSLSGIYGGDEQAIRHWMKTSNNYLNGIPKQLVTTPEGLVSAVQYLDAMRGKV